uniref:Uncharacterized protein n=1 Tax=Zea mays TaxID=4577 RepID=A0A804R7N9_MAIZE
RVPSSQASPRLPVTNPKPLTCHRPALCIRFFLRLPFPLQSCTPLPLAAPLSSLDANLSTLLINRHFLGGSGGNGEGEQAGFLFGAQGGSRAWSLARQIPGEVAAASAQPQDGGRGGSGAAREARPVRAGSARHPLRQPAACRRGPGAAHGGPGRRRGRHVRRGFRTARRVRAVGPRPPDPCPVDRRRRRRVFPALRPPPPPRRHGRAARARLGLHRRAAAARARQGRPHCAYTPRFFLSWISTVFTPGFGKCGSVLGLDSSGGSGSGIYGVAGILVGAVHPAAVLGGVGWRQGAPVGAERVRNGEGADGGVGVRDGHARGQEPGRRRRRRRGARRVRALADVPGHVVRGAGRRRQQGPRRLQRPPRLAPHAVARRPRRQGSRPPAPPSPPGSGSAVDCGAVRGGAVRGREEGGRRGVLHPEAVGGRGDAAAAERGSGGDHPARGVRVLQPAHGPAGAGGGLAPDAHPAARRRGRRVLGDHHQLVPGGLPRGGRRGDRARGAVRRDAVPVRRDGHEPHQDAHGGGVDHPGGRLRRAGPVHRLLHPAGRRPARLRLRGRALRAPAARRQGRRRAPRVRRGALAAAAGCGPGRWGAGDKIYRTVEMRFLTVGDGTDRADSYRKSSTITSS